MAYHQITGAGSPIGAVIPAFEGQHYRDTTGGVLYQASGLTNTDWIALSGYSDEQAQDAIGAALLNTASITWTYNDASNQISADVNNEAIDDRVAALLVAGSNISLTYDDGANTLTIASSGGGGGSAPDFMLKSFGVL